MTRAREALSASEKAYKEPQYADTFRRFRQEEKPSYRIYLAVLAASGATRTNIAARNPDPEAEAKRLTGFLSNIRDVLEQQHREFTRAYLYAFGVLAETALDASTGDEGEVSQKMFRKVTGAEFGVLYQKLLLRMDSEKIVRELEE